MGLDTITDTIVAFVRENQMWALPVVFLVAFGESFCFFSLILPGTTILVALAALLAASGVEASVVLPAVIVAGLGGTLGYAVSYWIGLYFKDKTPDLWPFSQYPHWIDEGKIFFDRYGAMGVFFGHFVGPVRAVIPVVAGMFAMPHVPFQIANVTSAFIWAFGVIVPSFYVVTFSDQLFAIASEYRAFAFPLLFLAAFAMSVPRSRFAVTGLIVFLAVSLLSIYVGGSVLMCALAGCLGALAGDLWSYQTGRQANSEHRLFGLSFQPEQRASARGVLNLRGHVLGLLVSKFLWASRGLVPFELGAKKWSLSQFIPASVVACCIWGAAISVPAALTALYFAYAGAPSA